MVGVDLRNIKIKSDKQKSQMLKIRRQKVNIIKMAANDSMENIKQYIIIINTIAKYYNKTRQYNIYIIYIFTLFPTISGGI